MKYMGSKNRIAKYIIPIMLKYRKNNDIWVEPFVRGGNVIDKIEGKRVGADSNKYVIEALLAIRDFVDYLPKNNKEFTEEDYNKLRKNDDYVFKGYTGFSFSYSGKWLGGWRRDGLNKRDYVEEAYKNAIKQSPNLQGVKFANKNYKDLIIPENSLIYCDPPYQDTTKYKDRFNHNEFWCWCKDMSKKGYVVFVSEYKAPEGFRCLWQGSIVSSLTKDTGSKQGIEKLFICTV